MSEGLSRPAQGETEGAPPRRLPIGGAGVLFWLSVRRDVLSRKTLLFALLFALPAVLAGLVRYYAPEPLTISRLSGVEHAFVFVMIPQALLPLAALLYSTGMIQDEIEQQTLTYLLVRPMARWAVYGAKLAATVALAAALCVLFTGATYAVLYARLDGFGPKLVDGGKMCVLFTLSLAVYCALFGVMSLVARRAMMLGIVYIVLFEGVFANVDFVVRRLTVIYYSRVLLLRWIDPPTASSWRIDLLSAPESATCLSVLLGSCMLLAAAGGLVFAGREFRVKTPEGS